MYNTCNLPAQPINHSWLYQAPASQNQPTPQPAILGHYLHTPEPHVDTWSGAVSHRRPGHRAGKQAKLRG